jgi:8-oxo-dGTP diphosphatase
MIIKKVISIFIENEEGKILFLHRRKDLKFHPDYWHVVGGHIEEDEDPKETMKRELKEELDLDDFELVKGPEFIIDKDTRNDMEFHVWLFVIKPKGEITILPEEHDDHKWVNSTDMKDYNIVPGLILNLKKLGYDA